MKVLLIILLIGGDAEGIAEVVFLSVQFCLVHVCLFSITEKTKRPNTRTSWKQSAWTNSALSSRSRQPTCMWRIVLVKGPPPQAGSAGTERTPSCCLSFFT